MKSFVKYLLLMFLFFPLSAFAELPKQVELDFAVLSGYVIMPMNDEYIVDLDDRDQLHVGDILTLVTPGETIYHPQTREVLGSVYIPTGYLEVVRINSGYSYVKPLSADTRVKNGAQVRRFEQVPALFVDSAEDDGTLARQVKMDLPQFKWLQEGTSEQPMLTFTLNADALVVKTVEGNLLHKYSVKNSQQLDSPPAPVRRPFVGGDTAPEQRIAGKVMTGILTSLRLEDEDRFVGKDLGIIRQNNANQRGVWLGPNIEGNPVGIAVADFDGDGFQETAVALDNRLLISQIKDGKYTEKADVPIPLRLKILSLDAIDLDHDGLPELCMTAVDNVLLASFIVKYDGTDYSRILDNIRWFLRVVEMPDGERQLIGQSMSSEDVPDIFQGKPFLIHLEGQRLVKGDEIVLPGLANMFSFVPFTDNEDKLNYAYLTRGDHLKVVSAEGVELWESNQYFGGTESCFMNVEGNWKADLKPTCILSRLIKTPAKEILAVQNDSLRIMQYYRTYKESRLLSLNWDGFSMAENWRTVSQKGYLGDFAYADANNDGKPDLAMAVKFKHEGLIDKSRSTIVIYELD